MIAAERVAVVIVAFNSAEIIGALLESIPPTTTIIVIDNASTDQTRAVVSRYPTHLIALDRNLGFGAACNRGAAATDREFVFFVNPDARLTASTLPALTTAADRHPEAAAFNPILLDEHEVPVLRAGSRFGRKRHSRNTADGHTDHRVDVLSGAALFCRREVFGAIGGFDERIFLYFEDDDLSLRLLAAGHALMHIAGAEVRHAQGQSTTQSPALAYFKNYCWMRSYRYVSQKHGHPFRPLKIKALCYYRLMLAWLAGDRTEQATQLGRITGVNDTGPPIDFSEARARWP